MNTAFTARLESTESSKSTDEMQNKYQYVCKPSASGSYKVTVKPYDEQKKLNERLVLVAQMCVLNQIAEDYATQLANIDFVKNSCRAFSNNNLWRFNDIKKEMSRIVGGRQKFERFCDNICKLVDDSEKNISWLENSIKSELVGKVKWQYIDFVITTGILGGLVSILIEVYRRLYNKENDKYEKIKENTNTIERSFGDTMLNKGVCPDYSCIDEPMNAFFKNVLEKSKWFVEIAKKERKLLHVQKG